MKGDPDTLAVGALGLQLETSVAMKVACRVIIIYGPAGLGLHQGSSCDCRGQSRGCSAGGGEMGPSWGHSNASTLLDSGLRRRAVPTQVPYLLPCGLAAISDRAVGVSQLFPHPACCFVFVQCLEQYGPGLGWLLVTTVINVIRSQ